MVEGSTLLREPFNALDSMEKVAELFDPNALKVILNLVKLFVEKDVKIYADDLMKNISDDVKVIIKSNIQYNCKSM